MRKTSLLALLIFLLFKTINTVAQVEVQDSLALVDLYNATNGSNWTNHTNWLKKLPVSSWFGITVDSNRVTELRLDYNNLTGHIPSSLGNLTHLKELLLAQQQLSDTIPSSLGNLIYLRDIDLDENNLSGTIPASLGNLINLQTLDLELNELTGSIPSSLGNFTELTYLDFSLNMLSDTIPESLGNLTKLERLYFLGNNFSGKIPSSFGNLLNLQIVYFSYNHFSDSIPATLGNLNAEVYLDGNNFTFSGMEGFAQEFPNTLYAPQAQIPLHAHESKFSVSVGGTLSNETFSWYKNNVLDTVITADSTYTFKTAGSYTVSVSNSVASKLTLNSDTITLTERMVDSLALVDLYNSTNGKFWGNNLNWLTSAPLETWYGVTLKNNRVDSLNLALNDLDGHLPVSIGNLTNVRDLIFTYNPITGIIPSSIGEMINLENIDFKQNKLTGSIPLSIGNLTHLKRLDLNFNNLTDSIPYSLGNLDKLKYLDLSGNSLNNAIPSSLGNLSSLTYLNFAVNNLTGSIPSSIGNLTSLDTIYLGGNKISGSIPASFKNLKNLRFINFISDSLNGEIPGFIGSLTKLKYLGLGRNYFSGKIPDSIGNLSNLKFLVLFSNQLNGNIPSSLGNLGNLTFLNLYDNHLSDSIPATLKNLMGSASADISVNNFTFSGMEGFVQKFPYSNYYPQATVKLKKRDSILYVSVGGTPENNTYNWYRNDTLVATIPADSTYKPFIKGSYYVKITNTIAARLKLNSDTLGYNLDTAITPASPRIEYVNRQEEGTDGWTNYYYDNNTPANYLDDTLLLSLKKDGQNIGNIGDTAFAVKLVATAAAGTNTAIKITNPLITNSSGYWVMNRYWQVQPTHEPTSGIGVRFYYNKQDLNDVNGSYPNHDLKNNKLIFYKTIGGNPDPTTNLAGATKIISILPATYASDSTWTYHQLTDTTQYAEFYVSSFSGGGGGGTGNNQALPVTLISFTASKHTDEVNFQWSVTNQLNTNYFELQRSVNGINYETVETVYAVNSHAPVSTYNGVDNRLLSGIIEYRLKIVSNDGTIQYSNIISIRNNSKFAISIRPNPVQNDLNLLVQSFQSSKINIRIFDLKGIRISNKEYNLVAGYNQIKLNFKNLSQGVYMICVADTNSIQYIKCIKQ